MVLSPFVFLPLYLYPYNISSWSNITTSIAEHPDLNFHVVIAPNLANVFPDKNYEAALTALNNFTNVVTLGYVATSWTYRDISSVMGDISSYAAWNNYTSGNISVQGIFFDEATTSTTNDSMSYMKNITTFAKSSLGPGRQHISFNPGVPVGSAFYDLADTINIFENAWSEFNLTAVTMLPWDLLAKSTYVIHNFTGDKYLQADLVSNLTESNVSGLLITTQDSYNEVSTLWPDFCDSMSWELDSGDLSDRSIARRQSWTSTLITKAWRTMRRWIL
ncbi:uncharacterized protein LY89DRAFT_779344 [Mollisia scopiformis]|uniref:Spherulin 4 n=1 Tax=Mollisia scopiformis TaxID=149040 RepID=A0A194XKB1_MOLSC|nr:uncharacterized protein LY89DRAFT_779344 [Mollisia scopiformis]KUJ20598.1 hypothetical protein LY89DRAFT_779344 [Mollisia scopiformis]